MTTNFETDLNNIARHAEEIFGSQVEEDLETINDELLPSNPENQDEIIAYRDWLNQFAEPIKAAGLELSEQRIFSEYYFEETWVHDVFAYQGGGKHLEAWAWDCIDWDNVRSILRADCLEFDVDGDTFLVYTGGFVDPWA